MVIPGHTKAAIPKSTATIPLNKIVHQYFLNIVNIGNAMFMFPSRVVKKMNRKNGETKS